MPFPVWGLLGVFTTTFIAPFIGVNAVEPVALALPQDIQYDEYAAEQLSAAAFSSDPQHYNELIEG